MGRGSASEHVYQTLKAEIIDLKLVPGSAIDDSQLARRFGLSRTPVREALVRLAGDGLITALTNRVTIVSSIDLLQLPDFFDAVTLFNRVTAREAAAKRSEADIETIRDRQARFKEAVDAKDAQAMIGTNRDFHVAIAKAGGNRYYVDLFSRVLDDGRRILRLYYSSFNDELPADYVTEHEQLIDAIVAQDVEAADKIGRKHADQIVRQIQSIATAERRGASSIQL